MTPFRCSLQELPECFLRQLALRLPESARLQLRVCCYQLLMIVDATGVKLSVRSTSTELALRLASQNVTSLDLTQAGDATDTLLHGHSSAGNLPSLQEVACSLNQLPTVSLLASKAGKLQRLKLVSSTTPVASSELWLTPGPTCLSDLHLDVGCHKLLTAASSTPQQRLLWSLISTQTKLQSLVLQHSRPREYSIDSCVMTDHCWQELIQKLTTLTRLDIGKRRVNNSRQSSTELQPDSTRGALPPVPDLLHLRCFGFDHDCEDSWNLAWIGTYTSLTSLNIFFCSAGEVDFEVLGSLQNLRTLSMHYYPDEYVTSDQLVPLTACSQLTCLRLDSLVVEPHHQPAATAPSAELSGVPAGDGVTLTTDSVQSATADQAAASSRHRSARPQLATLHKLVAGVICKAPVVTLAPNLTQLRDLDYDLGELELPSSFAAEVCEPLAGLDKLQLLGVNIFALVRHSAHISFTQLPSLTDLHVEMVGNLTGTHLSQEGLPLLPHLTRLVMTLPESATRTLDKTYTTEEDVLVWKNQSSLKCIRLRGTVRLGGFMVHDDMLTSMPSKLPNLRSIELVNCADLHVQHVGKLVTSKVAKHIVLQNCRHVSARDCMLLSQVPGNGVDLDLR